MRTWIVSAGQGEFVVDADVMNVETGCLVFRTSGEVSAAYGHGAWRAVWAEVPE